MHFIFSIATVLCVQFYLELEVYFLPLDVVFPFLVSVETLCCSFSRCGQKMFLTNHIKFIKHLCIWCYILTILHDALEMAFARW